ncbi:phage tail tip fiber protein [Acinetobacter baumannii]
MTGTTKNALLSELRKKKLITGSSTSSKTKSVGAIPVVKDKTLQTWIKGITNQLQEIDKSFVRSKDLARTGLVDVDGNGNISLPKPEDNSTIVPKAVEELKATGAYSTVTLDWKTPKSKFFGRNEVYRSEKNDFGTAVNIGSSTGDVYTDYVGNNSKAYYWVRTISKAGVEGALSASVYAETSIDIDYLLENLSEQISEGLLSQSIKDQLAGIDKNAEYIKSVESQVQEKITEVKNIIGKDIVESKLTVSDHLGLAQLRMTEAETRIEDYKKFSQSIVDAAKKVAEQADIDLQQNIDALQKYANDQVALLNDSVINVRKQAEEAQRIGLQEITDRKQQIANTLDIINLKEQQLKDDITGTLNKTTDMINAAKVAMGQETNTLINQKVEPITLQLGSAVKKIDEVAAQYVDLDKRTTAGFLAEAEARSNDKEAITNDFKTQFAEYETELGKTKAAISTESETRAAQDQAITKQVATVQAQVDGNVSAINSVQKTVVDLSKSVVEKTDQIQATLNTNIANTTTANDLARMQSLGKPLREDPTFKLGNNLTPYVSQAGATYTRQAKSADNPSGSTHEILIRSTGALGSGWLPNTPFLYAAPNKVFFVKQILKIPVGLKLQPYGNPLGTGGLLKVLGSAEGTGKFEVYYSIIQCGPDAGATLQGHFRPINSVNPPVATTEKPVDVIVASYEVWDVTAINDTIPKPWQDQVKANASYIETVDASVKLVNDRVTTEAKKTDSLKVDYEAFQIKTNADITNISKTTSDADKALGLRIDSTKAELVEADKQTNATVQGLTETIATFQESTATRFNSIDTTIKQDGQKVQGQIADVAKSVSTLEGTTNTKFSDVSASIKATDDVAKTAINNAAKAQETASSAVDKAEANSKKLLMISAKTSGLNNAIQATATEDFQNEWKITSGVNELKLIDEPTARGGKVLRVGNNNGNDTVWAHWNAFIPFDESKTYAIKYRYRRVSGNGGVYIGLAAKDASQASFVTISDTLGPTLSSSHYAEANATPALGEFVTGVSYYKGHELAGVSVGYGKAPLQNPRKLPSKAAFVSVMFIANYSGQSGEVDIDYIDLLDAESAVIGFNAEAKATDLFKAASTATQAVADRYTLLETQMRDAENKIASNALALNKAATKSDLESAMGQVATNINAAIDGLTLGGVNAVANSEAPRTSTAATNKEYLMYERSAELKAFYDENLNKQITISFEMAVPVIGPVQVYASNASAHTFSVTVNVEIPNEWIKYSVTVIPKPHTSSTTVSTIEFYGVYGSGRIPTIRKLQIEAGNKPTAWSPSPRDFNALIDAQAQAIKETNAEVKKQGDTISSQGVDLTKLKNDLITTNQEVSKRATTEALNITNSKVEDQQGKLKAVTEQATALSASLNRAAAAGTNLLINSNVVGTYNGVSYPHLRYKMGEDWEVGAKYTLLWCAEHTRGAGDTNSSLTVYAGGGSQWVQTCPAGAGKVINKVTFIKNSAGTAREIQFYMINKPTADKNSVGTVYWAVLVKGDLITTDAWIPSAYDYNAAVDQVNANFNDFKQTYVTDKEALTKRTSSLESGLSNAEKNIENTAKALQSYATNAKLDEVAASQTNQLTAEISKVKGAIDSASDSDSLLPDFNLKNPEDWISHYNYDLKQYFRTTTTGKVSNTVFRKDTSNPVLCWNYSRKALPTTRKYKVSFWVRRSSDSNGACYITILPGTNNGVFTTSNYSYVPINGSIIPANEEWILIEQVVTYTTHPQMKLGFALGHNGGIGWWELQGYKVEAVLSEKDVDTTLVRSTQLQNYSTIADTTKAVATATEAMESKFKQKFGNMWTDSNATLDSTRYTKAETNQAITDESKALKASISSSGGDNIIKNGDFSAPFALSNWRINSNVVGSMIERYTDANGTTWGRFSSTNTTTAFKGFIEQLFLADGLELNQTYTLSFKAKSLTAAQSALFLIIHRSDGSSNNQLSKSWPIYTDQETLCTYTFNTNIANLRNINIILYAAIGFAPDFLIREVQLEKGDLATGFRVNPRELKDVVALNAEKLEGTRLDVQKNADGIKSLTEDYKILKSDLGDEAAGTGIKGQIKQINTIFTDPKSTLNQSLSELNSKYGNVKQDLDNQAIILGQKITKADATEVFTQEIKAYSAKIDAIQYAEDNWILANDEPKSASITTGTNRTVAMWDLMYKHKDLPIKKGDPIVVRLQYAAAAGLVGATCSIQFHGATYSLGIPSFIVAASGEVELKGVFPSDVKATSFDFVPLGLRFDNAPANGLFTVTNIFVSRGNSAPNFKGGFRSTLKQNAQFVEDTFIKADVNKQVIAQQIQQYDALIPDGMSTVVKNTKVTADNTAQALATFKAVDFKQLQSSTDNLGTALDNTTMLAMMITNGKLLYGDVNFKKGMNSVSTYNNLNNGNVTVSRVPKYSDNPTTSTHEIEIKAIGSASPNWGGFVQYLYARANAVFIIKYLIKLPVGYKLLTASNALGLGGIDKFIGNVEGTGRYETYVRVVKCGSAAPFSTGGFVQVSGSPAPTAAAPLVWNLAQIESYDVTDYASADPTLQDFVSTANESLSTLSTFKETWASKLVEMSSKLDSKNSAYILNADLTNTNVERSIAASSQKITSEYTKAMKVQPIVNGTGKIFTKPLTWRSVNNTNATLVIKTPIVINAYMCKLKISGYNYTNKLDNMFDLDLAFYAYTSTLPFYQNMTARASGITLDTANATTKGIALALDSNNKVCILISKKDNWIYPAITVENAIITHTNPPDSFMDGWDAALETDLSVYKSITPFTVTSELETTAGAQQKVDVPLAQLSDIAADNKLTPVEKKQAKLVWDTIYKADSDLRAEAGTYGISVASYSTAFSTLNTYLAGLFANMNTTSTIDRATFINNFAAVHTARAALQRAISEKAKELADIANDLASKTKASLEKDYFTVTQTKEAMAVATDRMSALYSANGQSIMTSVLSTWESDWLNKTPSGNRAEMRLIEDSTCRGGFALRLGNNSGNDETWLNWFASLPIDDNKIYRVKYRFRRVSGTGTVYVGATCQNASKTKYIAQSNVEINDVGSSHYVVAGTAPALGTWVTGVAYFKGRSAGASTGNGTLANPMTFANKSAYFTPVFIGNYPAKSGEVDIDYIDIEDADSLADFESFKTAYATDKTAYTGVIETLTNTFGDKAIGLTEQKKFVDGVKGVATFLINNNGVASGWGTTSELVDGKVKTEFGVYSSRFFVATDTNTKFFPFIIDKGKVIIDTALIKEGTIKSAHIGTLGADKITSGDIAADRMKANIVEAARGQFQSLSSITATIGHLRTSETGARIEIADQFIKSFDNNGVKRVQIGNLEL